MIGSDQEVLASGDKHMYFQLKKFLQLAGMQLLLLVLLLCPGVIHTAAFSVLGGDDVLDYYVTPNSSNSHCPPNKPCLTINEYAQNSSRLFGNRTNVELLFLNGIHSLTAQSFVIRDVGHMRLSGTSNSFNINNPKVIIHVLCNACYLGFANISNLFMEDIAVEISNDRPQDIGIGMENIQNYTQTSVYLNSAKSQTYNVQNLVLAKSKFVNSSLSVNVNINPDYQLFQYPQLHLTEAKMNITSCAMFDTDITVTVNTVNLDVSFSKTNTSQNQAYGLQVSAINKSNVVLNVLECSFFYNQQGISIIMVEHSRLDFTIDQTHLVGNLRGGILIYSQSYNVINVNIKKTVFKDSNLQAISIIGDSKLNNSTSILLIIEDSTVTQIRDAGIEVQMTNITVIKVEQSSITHCIGEGLKVLNTFNSEVLTVDIYKSNITDSMYGVHVHYQSLIQQSSFIVTHCNISNHMGLGIQISKNDEAGYIVGDHLSLMILESTISHNRGGGMHLECSLENNSSLIAYLQGLHVSHNQNEGILFAVRPPLSVNTHFNVTLENCTISNTFGLSLVAYGISNYENNHCQTLFLKKVLFSQNRDTTGTRLATVQVVGPVEMTILDCAFEENYGTPIQMVRSILNIWGDVMFVNNTGLNGGALSLEFSRVSILNNTRILFVNNSAIYTGGAIFVQSSRMFTLCFYQLPDISNVHDLTIQLEFANNRAARGGDNIFGAALRESCAVSSRIANLSISLFKKYFHFNDKPSLSPISSKPQRVCLCNSDGQPMCADMKYIFQSTTRFPGENFNVSAVVVGYEFGTVSSEIYANFITRPLFLPPNISVQTVDNKKCSNLTYFVHSVTNEILTLTAAPAVLELYDPPAVLLAINDFIRSNVIPDVLLTTPVFINVTIDGCPPGFNISGPLITCECNALLRKNGIATCFIENRRGLITRSGTQWLGVQNGEVIVSPHCPFGYCKTKSITIDLTDLDLQCSDHRSGVLCGQCQGNYSMILGNTQCWLCSDDRYLSLLMAIIAAGLILVLVIKYLDLTVTNGTLNGLIFYANIVWSDQGMLFPLKSNNLLRQILNTFIAWLNLDLGINTCFFTGLNAFWKTWLQFIFPIYIWIITGLIILLCRYSILATRLFGKNSISVLATLFLLSFTKLLRTIITTLNFTYIHTSDGHMVVWTEDGNVDYVKSHHAALFTVSVIMLLFLWMPFMLVLLFIQPLKRIAHIWPFRWISKWKPFFDAYIGPLKDRYHYWIGLSLAARSVLLLANVILMPITPEANLVAIVIVTTVLGLFPFVYKKWSLSLLENSFFFNLVSLACGVLYADYKNDHHMKTTVVSVSVGIAFVQFIFILLFHFWCLICRCVKKLKNRKLRMIKHSTVAENIRQSRQRQQVGIQEEELLVDDGYREPLLSTTES